MGQRIKPESVPGTQRPSTNTTDTEGREDTTSTPSPNPDVIPEQRGEF